MCIKGCRGVILGYCCIEKTNAGTTVNAFGSVRTGNMYSVSISNHEHAAPTNTACEVRANASRTRPNQAISQYPFLWLYRTTPGTKTERKQKNTHKTVRSLGRPALADRACATQFTVVLLVLVLYQVQLRTAYLVGLDLIPAAHTRYDPTLISSKLSP